MKFKVGDKVSLARWNREVKRGMAVDAYAWDGSMLKNPCRVTKREGDHHYYIRDANGKGGQTYHSDWITKWRGK